MKNFSRILRSGCALVFLLAPLAPGQAATAVQEQDPPRDYLILINYELGMHCTGFDFAYCCVLPPYNSILAQVVKTGRNGEKPVLLGADPADPEVLVDGDKRYKLAYTHEDPYGVPNTYSAQKKLAYWGVGYGDNKKLPDVYFSNLYLYKDLEGSNPENTSADAKKLHVGLDVPIGFNQGPTGQHVGRGFLRYSGDTGTVVFTDSPAMENVPIKLTNPGIWEALGLPLTPFNDKFTALIHVEEDMVQPYQKSVVTLVDPETREPVLDSSGKPVRFFGLNPIDVPNCARCHSNERANGKKHLKYQEEYDFWREVRRSSEWYAQLKAAAVSILEIHDANHGTNFLANWPASGNNYLRLGRGTVMCQDCHADNVIGRLFSKTSGEMDAQDVQKDHAGLPDPEHLISPLTEAIHKSHQRNNPLPDSLGFAGGCQGCHPSHRSDLSMNDFPLTEDGRNFFAKGDIRDAKGCFTGRDVHDNPGRNTDGAETASHLNPVGEYLLSEVMMTKGKDQGLYCTNCHNMLSRELYKADHLTDAVNQTGETLRNQPLEKIAAAVGVGVKELQQDYINPKSPMQGEDTTSGVYRTWDRTGQTIAPIARIQVDDKGNPVMTPPDEDGDQSVIIVDTNPNGKEGVAVPYDAATHGRDYWLAAGEPHCADCHQPPYVESMGGGAFPIDQPGKYALMRYSKGHAQITCQGCHESIHGLYPVDPAVDIPSYQQAALLNPDGSHGPLKCAGCHAVNKHGVPSQYPNIIKKDGPYWADYGKAVELAHRLR
jgi:mono/diheme cytochrome c family protein